MVPELSQLELPHLPVPHDVYRINPPRAAVYIRLSLSRTKAYRATGVFSLPRFFRLYC